MKKKEINILIGMIMFYLIYVLLIYPKLPSDLPMQFSISGEVNWTLPKPLGILCSSCIPALVLAARMSSKKKFSETFIFFSFTLLLIAALLGYIAFFR